MMNRRFRPILPLSLLLLITTLLPSVGMSRAILPAPGGVETNLTLWLKADAGVTLTGTDVSQWDDQSDSGLAFIQRNSIGLPLFETDNAHFNFNPSLDFVVGNHRRLHEVNAGNLIDGSAPDNYSFFIVAVKEGNDQTLFTHRNLTDNQYQFFVNGGGRNGCRVDFHTGAIPDDQLVLLGVTYDGTAANRLGHFNGVPTIQTNCLTNTQTSPDGSAIVGSGPSNNFAGHIAEVILYDRMLSSAEIQQLHTYLALKYGRTIPHDYLASDGTLLWDATTTYNNQVTGIGRDDTSGLQQKQSRNVEPTALVTIGHGDIAPTNAANPNDLTDGSFLLWGDNGASIAFTHPLTGTTAKRMERVWQSAEIGNVGTIKLQLSAAPFANSAAPVLITSTDPIFDSSDTQISLTADGNGNLFATLDFDSGNSYFTFAKAGANTLDSDGDTLPDSTECVASVIAARGPEQEIRVWAGNNSGSFALEPIISAVNNVNFGRSSTEATLTADVNGDGWSDVLAAIGNSEPFGPAIFVWLSNQDGSFAADPIQSTLNAVNFGESNTELTEAFDVNGDGIADVVAVLGNDESDGPAMKTWIANGDGTFAADPIITTLSDGNFGVGNTKRTMLADVTGDNIADVVAALGTSAAGGPAIKVWAGKGDGTFFTAPLTTVVNEADYGIGETEATVIGDVTGDGIADILAAYSVGNDNGPAIKVWVALGNGLFAPDPLVSPISATLGNVGVTDQERTMVADINGDGIADVVSALGVSESIGPALLVWVSNGDGTFPVDPIHTIPNNVDFGQSSTERTMIGAVGVDTDGDGLGNCVDIDSDNDGLTDGVEAGADPLSPIDSDGDLIPDLLDLDSDGDGIPDNVEAQATFTYLPPSIAGDIDGNGLNDAYDSTNGLSPVDSDQLGDNPDYLDADSDEDGLLDSAESGLTRTNTDTNGDGLDDGINGSYSDPNGDVNDPALDLDDTVAGGDVDFRQAGSVVIPTTTLGLVYANAASDIIDVWLANSDGTFVTVPQRTNATVGNMGVGNNEKGMMADVTQDGIPDIVFANINNSIDVWAGNGDGTFATNAIRTNATIPNIGQTNAKDTFLSDTTGDGIPDLLFAVETNDVIDVWVGNGDGTFAADAIRTNATIENFGTAANEGSFSADVNGDNLSDLLFVTINDTIDVWLSNGDGTFATTAIRTNATIDDFGTTDREASLLADVTGDGHADLLYGFETADYIDVWVGNGDGTFATTAIRTLATIPNLGFGDREATFLADLTGDGVSDLIFGNENNNYIDVWIANGDGTFAVEPVRTEIAIANFGISDRETSLIGDVTGDDHLDLVFATEQTNTFDVYPGLGNGAFLQSPIRTNAIQPRLGYSENAVTFFGDLNGDSVDDLLFVEDNDDTVSVWRGQGDGRYAVEATVTTITIDDFGEALFESAFLADIDADSQLDLIYGNESNDYFDVWRGNGADTFITTAIRTNAALDNFGVGPNEQSFVVEVTGDSWLDIVYANSNQDVIDVWVGNGDGTFAATAIRTNSLMDDFGQTGTEASFLTDLTGDGIADLFYTNENTNYFDVWVGNGDGTFALTATRTNATIPNIGVGTVEMTFLLDVNGDDSADVIYANESTDIIDVWMGNGNGTFATTATRTSVPIAQMGRGTQEASFIGSVLGDAMLNAPPVAVDDQFVLLEDTSLSDTVTQNDNDPDADPLTAILDDDVITGTLTFNSDGSFDYQPDRDFTGVVTFTYHLNDGEFDSNSATVTLTVLPDKDGDGIEDGSDIDTDNDGILNVTEQNGDPLRDSDGDGFPDHLDIDSDDDGIPDVVEVQTTLGFVPPSGGDVDEDGLLDVFDPDQGGTAVQLIDSDGVDGIPDYLDRDSDNDNAPDLFENGMASGLSGSDTDLDGLNDAFEGVVVDDPHRPNDEFTAPAIDLPDSDEDALSGGDVDYRDGDNVIDSDGDTIPDRIDQDDDNDGLSDVAEGLGTRAAPTDLDQDGIPDHLDLDSDNNGLPDTLESGAPDLNVDGIHDGWEVANPDEDGDGWADAAEANPPPDPNSDRDPVPDRRDRDNLGMGMPDTWLLGYPDVNADGVHDGWLLPNPDTNGNGWLDALEPTTRQQTPDQDRDGDGVAAIFDIDGDGDGLITTQELDLVDENFNGIADFIETASADSDGDGLLDVVDPDAGGTPLVLHDDDNDGLSNLLDIDSDDDGIPDNVEGQTTLDYIAPSAADANGNGWDAAYDVLEGGQPLLQPNSDGRGSADWRDRDSDNDFLPDSYENGKTAIAPVGSDSDGDGLDDAFDETVGFDVNDVYDVPAADLPNSDGERDVDYRSLSPTPPDTDGDGIPDIVEGEGDFDIDGIPDAEDYDPTGYLYEETTGLLLIGGSIEVVGAGAVTLLLDGSDGRYHFKTDGTTGIYTLIVTPPTGYQLSANCLPQPQPLVTPAVAYPLLRLGGSQQGETNYLDNPACTNNRYYMQLELTERSATVVNNNIPLTSNLDFGDLPASFNATTLHDDGARHATGSLYLGATNGVEGDGVPSDSADSDDSDDGIRLADPRQSWIAKSEVTLVVTVTGKTGHLVGWFDWDGDGAFGADEVTVDVVLHPGRHKVHIDVPERFDFLQQPFLFSRFRLFDPNVLPPVIDTHGAAQNGEVEDYRWQTLPPRLFLPWLLQGEG